MKFDLIYPNWVLEIPCGNKLLEIHPPPRFALMALQVKLSSVDWQPCFGTWSVGHVNSNNTDFKMKMRCALPVCVSLIHSPLCFQCNSEFLILNDHYPCIYLCITLTFFLNE